jgi:uncharacterized membrane protein YphA (DoxX/SURF4 family)
MRRWWSRFFFEPADTLPLALCRVVHGVVALMTAAFLFPDRYVWFGNRGLISSETAADLVVPITSLFRWVDDPERWITPLLVVMMLAGATLAAGLFTRTSAAIIFVILMALHHRAPMILNGADLLLRINMLLLAFSHAGASLSLDRRLRPERSTLQPPWAQRLMQIQLSVTYAGTLLWKLRGAPWIDGTAVYYVMSVAQFQKWRSDGFFVPLIVSKIATWGTLVIEAAAATLIWTARFRNVVIAAAVLLHLAMDLTLNVPFFEWLMIGTLVLFSEGPEVRRGLQRVRVRRR